MCSGQNYFIDVLPESETFSNTSNSREQKMHNMLKVNITKTNKSSYSTFTPKTDNILKKTFDVPNVIQTVKKFEEKYSLKNVTKSKLIAKEDSENSISDQGSLSDLKNIQSYSASDKNFGEQPHFFPTNIKLSENKDLKSNPGLSFQILEDSKRKYQKALNSSVDKSPDIKKSSSSDFFVEKSYDSKLETYKDEIVISKSDSIPEELLHIYKNSDFDDITDVSSINSEINILTEVKTNRNSSLPETRNTNQDEEKINSTIDKSKGKTTKHFNGAHNIKIPVKLNHSSKEINSEKADDSFKSLPQLEETKSKSDKFVHDLYRIYTIEDLFSAEETFKGQPESQNENDINKLSEMKNTSEVNVNDTSLKSEEEIDEELDEVYESQMEGSASENKDFSLIDTSLKTNSSYSKMMSDKGKSPTVKNSSSASGHGTVMSSLSQHDVLEETSRKISDVGGYSDKISTSVESVTDKSAKDHSLQISTVQNLNEKSVEEAIMNIKLPSSFSSKSKYKIVITKCKSDNISVNSNLSAGFMQVDVPRSTHGNRSSCDVVTSDLESQTSNSCSFQSNRGVLEESESGEIPVNSNKKVDDEEITETRKNIRVPCKQHCSVGVQTKDVSLSSFSFPLNVTYPEMKENVVGSSDLLGDPYRYSSQTLKPQGMLLLSKELIR